MRSFSPSALGLVDRQRAQPSGVDELHARPVEQNVRGAPSWALEISYFQICLIGFAWRAAPRWGSWKPSSTVRSML
jgi:hypothetical protein